MKKWLIIIFLGIIVFAILQWFMVIPFRLGVACGGYGAGYGWKKECDCVGLKTEFYATPGGNSYSCLGQCNNCHCYEMCNLYPSGNCSSQQMWFEVNCT
jgi:hypothetical protein